MRFEWDEAKRLINLERHGLDFEDAGRMFAGPVLELEDDREDYGEPRYRVFGMLEGRVVVIIYTPRGENYRMISMRRGNRYETDFYYQEIGN